MKLNTLKQITLTLCTAGLLCFPFDSSKAQNAPEQKNQHQNTTQEINRVDEDLNLYADKVNIKHELAIFDSLLLKMRLEEEARTYPADELYGSWPTAHVKAYPDAVIPDTFKIDVSSFVMPCENNRITSKYGMRRRGPHYGTDLKVHTGDTIRAAFDGKIRVKKYERRGYGYYLVVRHHNGLETVYGHLSKYLVGQDDVVKAGQPIALGGNTGRSTGSHLHFECRFMGQPINPEQIVDFENSCIHDDVYVFKKRTSGRAVGKNGAPEDVRYHRIKSGDSLSKISKKYGVSIRELCRLNGIKETSILRIGQSIRCS